jgi:hypothetical protein
LAQNEIKEICRETECRVTSHRRTGIAVPFIAKYDFSRANGIIGSLNRREVRVRDRVGLNQCSRPIEHPGREWLLMQRLCKRLGDVVQYSDGLLTKPPPALRIWQHDMVDWPK